MGKFTKTRKNIIEIGCMLLDNGLIVGTWGNLSARVDGTDYIAITPSGRNYRSLESEDIVVVEQR